MISQRMKDRINDELLSWDKGGSKTFGRAGRWGRTITLLGVILFLVIVGIIAPPQVTIIYLVFSSLIATFCLSEAHRYEMMISYLYPEREAFLKRVARTYKEELEGQKKMLEKQIAELDRGST